MAAGKVSVLGAGAWGTALAKVLAEKGDEVVLWARNADVVTQVNARHENERYLPGVKLPDSLTASLDLKESLEGATMVVFVAPSHATREVAKLASPFIGKDVPIVSATPVFTMLLGLLVFGREIVTWRTVATIALIVPGVVLVALHGVR